MMNWKVAGFFVAFVLGVATAGAVWTAARIPKHGYILNQRVFERFEGRKVLEDRLEKRKASHARTLDSIQALILPNDGVGMTALYDRKAAEFASAERALSEAYLHDVWVEINGNVSKYGKEHGFDFVFGANGTGSIMYASDARDITEEVILYLNEAYEAK